MKWRQALLAPAGLRGRSWGSARGRSSRLRPRSRCGSIPTAYPRGARRTRASPAGRASRRRLSAGSPDNGSPDGTIQPKLVQNLCHRGRFDDRPPPKYAFRTKLAMSRDQRPIATNLFCGLRREITAGIETLCVVCEVVERTGTMDWCDYGSEQNGTRVTVVLRCGTRQVGEVRLRCGTEWGVMSRFAPAVILLT